LLEAYLARYREATARETIGSAPAADARVISRANVSNTPYFPKKMPIVLVATLAALLLSTGFIVTGEIMRASAIGGTRSTLVDVPEEAAPPTVPHPAVGVPVSEIADIASRLMETGHQGRRVAVFNAGSGAPTTLAALTLARALARDSRAVLVDLAPGNPNLAAISSDPRAPGIADVIRGTSTFAGIITKDKLSRLHLVSAGVVAGGNLGSVLSLTEFTAAVEALARSYDFFIIDAASAPDALISRVAEVAPRAVLVAPNGTSRGLQAAYDHFVAAGFRDVAVATGASSPTPSSPAPVRAAVA
jgi:Mrp family chromosome partitioning ATPase